VVSNSSSTNGFSKAGSHDPTVAFVTGASSTSEVVCTERRPHTRSTRSYDDSAWKTGITSKRPGRRRSQPNYLTTELQDYGVPYESPRQDDKPQDQPCFDGPLSAAQHQASTSEASVPPTNNEKATPVSTAQPAALTDEKDVGGPTSFPTSDTEFKRSESLRSSSEAAKRRQTDVETVGEVFVRQRAASFSGGRTSRRKQNEEVRQHRRRMSWFSLPEDRGDGRATRTSEMVRDIRGGRLVDPPGLPPVHRPASSDSDRRPRRPRCPDDDAFQTTSGTTVLTSVRSAAGHEDEPQTAETTTTRRDSRHRRHSNRHHHRHHGNSDDDKGGGDEHHRHRRHHRLHHRSTSERRTSSDGESIGEEDSHRTHGRRGFSLDGREHHPTPPTAD